MSAQKESYHFTGIVKDSVEVVKDAHIVNLVTKKGSSTNDSGYFTIKGSVGDSLLVSSIQHYTMYHVISEKDIVERNIQIELSSTRYQLDEVIIKKNRLTGSLILDRKDESSAPREVNAVSLGLPFAGRKKLSHIDRKFHTATTSSSGVPLNLLINMINGKLKKLKEEKKVIEENKDVSAMYIQMKNFLESEFKIKKDDQYRFLYYCRSDSSFSKKVIYNELALIKFLRIKSEEFKAIQTTNKNNNLISKDKN